MAESIPPILNCVWVVAFSLLNKNYSKTARPRWADTLLALPAVWSCTSIYCDFAVYETMQWAWLCAYPWTAL